MKEKQLTLFGLAWPILIETALFMTLGIVDVFVLSQYNDLAAGAVNTANQAVSIATIVFTVVSTASAVLISQYLGAGKKQAAGRIAALAITLNLLTGLLVTAPSSASSARRASCWRWRATIFRSSAASSFCSRCSP